MSEDKNTALGAGVLFGYSHVVPATHHSSRKATTPMIPVAILLAALVLLTSWDNAEAGHQERVARQVERAERLGEERRPARQERRHHGPPGRPVGPEPLQSPCHSPCPKGAEHTFGKP